MKRFFTTGWWESKAQGFVMDFEGWDDDNNWDTGMCPSEVLAHCTGLTPTSAFTVPYTDSLVIEFACGSRLLLWHHQDCCESVYLEDGHLEELQGIIALGGTIVCIEERSHSCDEHELNGAESMTWTFYEVTTTKGSVTLRFTGTSNGYYSESVDILFAQGGEK
jgi:hypothetical protein